jgi:LCP family protein required for cell wall assembly
VAGGVRKYRWRVTDDGFGPPLRGRHRRRFGRRLAKVALVGVLVVALVALLTGVALAFYTTAQFEREQVRGLQRAAGGQMNVLVVGSDSREGLTDEELLELGTEQVEGKRTDTIFLLSLRGGRAAMLSFPRDLLVTHCDGRQGRINAAYASGGPSCLVETVTMLSGVPVTHYLELNFLGFMRVVDAVGGVSVWLDQPMVDRPAGVDLPAGCNRLDGTRAIGFVRARTVDGDLGRIARQQRFVAQMARAIAAPTTLLNVPRLFSVAGNAGRSVTADPGLGPVDLLRIARVARGLAGGGLASYTVPATPANVGGAAVLVPSEAEAAALFTSFRDGSVLETAAAEAGLTPADVRVAVLNGAGIQGLAGQGRDYLTQRGFQVTEVGNAEPVDRTVVRHRPELEPAARLVAQHVPGAATEPSTEGPPLALVLGPDVDLAAPPPPADEPAPDAPPPPDFPLGAGPVPDGC